MIKLKEKLKKKQTDSEDNLQGHGFSTPISGSLAAGAVEDTQAEFSDVSVLNEKLYEKKTLDAITDKSTSSNEKDNQCKLFYQ